MTCDYFALPHPGIRTLHPYIPGKPISALAEAIGKTDIIKLASNENPFGASPKVLDVLRKMSAKTFADYPAPDLHPVKERLSEQLGIDKSQILLSNGSDCLVSLLLTIFALHTGKHMLTHDLAFISYQIQAQTLGIPTVSTPLLPNYAVDMVALMRACTKDTGLLVLANPNNPTGGLIPIEDLRRLLEHIPKTCIFLLDEAYHEFAYPLYDRQSLNLLDEFPNLVITRTFSKAYGLAGLRLGYAMSSKKIHELMHRVQLPFTVSQTAMDAGLAALEDRDFLKKTIANNHQELQAMQNTLEQRQFFTLPSHTNFISFDCGTNCLAIYEALLQYGIIVRPLTPYGLSNFIRVTIGRPEDNQRFLKALAEIFRSK